MISSTQVPQSSANPVASRGASRMLVMGGIALILAGMIFGDIFAAFILHPNADRIGASLLQAAAGWRGSFIFSGAQTQLRRLYWLVQAGPRARCWPAEPC